MTNRIFGMTSSKAAVAALLCCVSALVIGCTTSQFLSGTDMQPMAGGAIQGVVHGGNLPVIGAKIQLWTVGSGATYGSAAATLGPTLTTDSTGSFAYTPGSYTCPSGTTQTYITSSGGDPGMGTPNPNIMLAAAMGNCSGLASAFININEVTTAATAYALGQYFGGFGNSSADTFGSPNTSQAQAGITNAMATVSNLVNTTTGTAVTSAVLPGGCTVPGTLANPCIAITPEATKLNTVADILAACVNSAGGTAGDSSNCGKLFGAVVTGTGTAPTDTLQAAVYMSLNPTSNNANGSATNLATLFGLVAASGAPFNSTLAAQPTDWTLGVRYADSSATFLVKPLNVAVDSTGNVWVVSNNSGLGGLAEISPTGSPLANPQTLNVLTSGVNTSFLFAATAENPRSIAIDTANNVWITTSSSATDTNTIKSNGTVFEYTTGGGSTGYQTGKSGYGLAIDGSNNVFVSQQSSSAVYELYEFPGGDLTKPVGYPIASATPGTAGTSGTNTFIAPEYLAFDPAGNLWMTGGVAASNFTANLTNIASASTIITGCGSTYPCALTTSLSSNTYNKITLGSVTGESGISVGASSIYIADAISGNGVSYLTGGTDTDIGSTASFTLPKFVATDGAGNVWVSNTNTTPTGTNPTAGGSISELSSAGAILSPITPNPTVTNPGYVHTGFTNGSGIAVDPSGNVWAADSGNSVFELVGAAAPTVTPIALALKNGTVAAKP